MEKERIKLNEDFENAKSELRKMGKVNSVFVNNDNERYYRLSITINNETFTSVHEDRILATIHLRNQI